MGVYSLVPVQGVESLREVLPTTQHWIEKALTKAPELTLDSVVLSLVQGKSLLWVALRNETIIGIVTTKIINHPNKKTILIHLLGGEDIEEWVGEIDKIEEVGRWNGCDSVEIHGRPAWKKLLSDYKTDRIILNKEL